MKHETHHGVVVVDKPRGPTSHDVVGWVRRVFGTRTVGHAGTLDPIATGVLVVGVGEGTKLTSYLMADRKEYTCTLALGEETDSIDAQGTVVATRDVPNLDVATVARAAERFVGSYLQRAPRISAIKQSGVALYERARRGETVEPPLREVECHAIDVLGVGRSEIELRVACGKGFYVRSLARDLADALGTVGHLTALRRTRSGAFDVERALSGELLREAKDRIDLRSECIGRLMRVEDALGGLTPVSVDAHEALALEQGKLVRFESSPASTPVAVLDPERHLVAIADWASGMLKVRRGFPRSLRAASLR